MVFFKKISKCYIALQTFQVYFVNLLIALFKEQLSYPKWYIFYCNNFSGCQYVRSDLAYPSVPMLVAETGYWLWLPYYGHYKNIIETCHAGWRKCRFPGGFSIGHCYEYHQTLGRFLHVYISSDDFKILKYTCIIQWRWNPYNL